MLKYVAVKSSDRYLLAQYLQVTLSTNTPISKETETAKQICLIKMWGAQKLAKMAADKRQITRLELYKKTGLWIQEKVMLRLVFSANQTIPLWWDQRSG